MDIWSAGEKFMRSGERDDVGNDRLLTEGCVMYELITLRPLFPGSNELDQINKIHDILGTPSSSVLEKFQQ